MAPLEIPTHLYFGRDDEADPDRLVKGWKAAVGGLVVAHEFPGGHFFLRSARDSVISALSNHMAAAVAAG